VIPSTVLSPLHETVYAPSTRFAFQPRTLTDVRLQVDINSHAWAGTRASPPTWPCKSEFETDPLSRANLTCHLGTGSW
jgi:hypothetical protein